jgi:hypothetical protein
MVVCGQINGSADDSIYRVKSEEEKRRNVSATTLVTPSKVSKAPPKWRRDEGMMESYSHQREWGSRKGEMEPRKALDREFPHGQTARSSLRPNSQKQ